MSVFGGIEAGGTKFVCAIGTGPDDVRASKRFLTTSPEETLATTVDFFREQQRESDLLAIGIGSFGPVDPDPQSPTFGHITSTPKPGWRNVDFAGAIRRALGIPVGFDTDVNAAALGEHRWGAARGLADFVYLTIGTGVGGGAMTNGQLMHGLVHPELGHIFLPHDRERDPFPGNCPYHGDCLEGLASGPAIESRWGKDPSSLPENHPAWDLEARYLALAVCNFVCTLSPKRVILGGGVMEQPALLPLVRRQVQELLNGYVQAKQIIDDIDDYIVAPGLGTQSGVLGAIALAELHQSSNGSRLSGG
jgi:fructokinase